MGLKILYGDKLADLARALKAQLLKDRAGADPFSFVQVVVPNGNVAKWLQIRHFATEPALCAGIEFPFMEKRLTQLLAESLTENERKSFRLLPDHAYARAILAILLAGKDEQPDYADLAPFRRYLLKEGEDNGDVVASEQKQARMAWQLADKLANLMDSYEVHRPEIVDAWLGKSPDQRNPAHVCGVGETEKAEAALAKALWGENGVFPENGGSLSLRQLFDKVKSREVQGPSQKLYFFGHPTLSLLQVRILLWLARTHEVIFFHANPCREYWGDITTAKEDRKALLGKRDGTDPEEALVCDNALLKSLGVAGRETLRLLIDAEEANGQEENPAHRVEFVWEPVDVDGTPASTVLGKVQESIRNRTNEVVKIPQDASVQIVGTPGLRREVEMVYNSILGSVCRPQGVTGERPWPACTFSDIAILVPDMKTYRPVIEAVFEARGEVPYALIDTTAGEDSQYLRGFLSLVELGRSGLSRERLFGVLENPCVQLALGFTREDVLAWRALTEKIGAFDGFDHDAAKGYFDWSWALRRLRLASVANAFSEDGEDVPLVKDGGDTALKFSEVVELLYRDLQDTFFDEYGQARKLPCLAAVNDQGERGDCWAERLGRLANNYLAIAKDDNLEGRVRQTIMGTLYSLGSLPGEQNLELPVAAVELFTGGLPCRRGSYLTSGVTIASLNSMALLPFSQVYVLGLGAGGFPGQTSASTLDVRGAGWRLGDVSVPNQNRFLFLEMLMSVRDRLVLSYPNHDIEKDAELFASGIVRELESFLGAYVVAAPFREFKNYPLLERGEVGLRRSGEKRPTDPIVWEKTDPYAGLLPTYSVPARKLARERLKGAECPPAVDATPLEPSDDRIEVSAKALADFIRNPVRAVMRHRFGIAVAGYLEADLEPDSPLGVLQGPDRWELEAKWLEPKGQAAVESALKGLERSGRLPVGFLGEFAKGEILQNASRLDAVRNFMASFGLSGGEDNTLHLSIPAELGSGDETQKIRFVAEIPNWKESSGVVSVLVTGKLEDKVYKPRRDGTCRPPDLQELPSDRGLEAFLAFLMKVGYSTTQEVSGLCLGVADLAAGHCGKWIWPEMDAPQARAYLEKLVLDYWTFEHADPSGKLIDVLYRKVVGALPKEFKKNRQDMPTDWNAILEKATAEDTYGSKSSFNSTLVVEQNLDAFKRPPTEEELSQMFETRYLLPLSGVRQ